MKAIDILSEYEMELTDRKKLVRSNSYLWANTVDRTTWSLNKSMERFDPINNTRLGNSTVGIIHALNQMINTGYIENNFTVLDIFCGTGAMLFYIKKNFPSCKIIGADLLNHNSWKEIMTEYNDSKFFSLDYFKLEKDQRPLGLDLIITFNTFRGWANSVGPEITHSYTKTEFSNWVKSNSKYFITDRGPVESYFKMLPFEKAFDNLKVAFSK